MLTDCNSSLMISVGTPLVTKSVNPYTTFDIIRVITKGAILSNCVPIPFSKPTNPPRKTEYTIITEREITEKPLAKATVGPRSAVMDIIAPTDISIPALPEITTVACPIATRERILAVMRRLLILFIDIYPLVRLSPMISSPMEAIIGGA